MEYLTGCNRGFSLSGIGAIYNYPELKRKLRHHNFSTNKEIELLLHLVEENYNGNLIETVENVVKLIEGDFAFGVRYGNEIVIARDPLGVVPIFYGKKSFSFKRRELWKNGEEAKTLKPGEVLNITNGEKKRVEMQYEKRTIENPVEELEVAIMNSIEKRTRNVGRYGIFFSGGLDSSILARFSEELEKNFSLFSVALRDSHDYKLIKELSKDREIIFREIEMEELEGYVRKVIGCIESCDKLKVCIGIPTYIACEEAKKAGVKVVLSGLGADELFAGYKKYLYVEDLESALMRDFERMHTVNLERDTPIAIHHSLSIRFPFLDKEVISIAFSIPTDLKIREGKRKYILREITRRKGINIIEKKAIQYSTGVEKALRKIAKEKSTSLENYLKKTFNDIFNN